MTLQVSPKGIYPSISPFNKFEIIENHSKQFICDMVNLCETDEAEMILLNDLKIDHYFHREVGAYDLLNILCSKKNFKINSI